MRPFLRRFPAWQLPGGLPFALLCAILTGVGSIEAATLIVTTTADSGPGSLRDTIAAAGDGDTIQFDPALNGQTINLTSAELAINRNITINGPGANLLSVQRNTASGTPDFRIFNIASSGANTAIPGLTIANGRAAGTTPGVGISNNQCNVTISNSTMSGNPWAASPCLHMAGTFP